MIPQLNNYFEAYASNNNDFLHGHLGKTSFLTGDIDKIKIGERDIKYPLMMAGFNPIGIEKLNSVYTFNESIGNYRTISYNVGLLKEVDNVDSPDSNIATVEYLEALADDLVKQVFEDRLSDDCSMRHLLLKMSDDIRMYGPHTIGDRKIIALTINFNFKIRL